MPSAAFDDENLALQPEPEDQDTTFITPAEEDVTTPINVEPPSCRTRRAVRAPQRYEPETGRWVSQ